ncbi:MAG: type II toxin-antitoxin system VapC family toxin [Saprospiraceae bacterium]
METICLDTSILIAHRRAKDKSATDLFALAGRYKLAITSITVFELWRGDNQGEDAYWLNLSGNISVLDFDFESAKIAGQDFLDLQKRGVPIGIEDILIVSVAKRHQLRVATTNTAHFSRISGLTLIDLKSI